MFGFGKKAGKKQGHLDKIDGGHRRRRHGRFGRGLAPKNSETRKEVGRQTGKALRPAKEWTGRPQA